MTRLSNHDDAHILVKFKHKSTVRRLRSIISLYSFHIHFCINSQNIIPRLMIKFHTVPQQNKRSQCASKPIAITIHTKLVNAKVVYIRNAHIIPSHLHIFETSKLLHAPIYLGNYHLQHIRCTITTFTFTTAMSLS